MSDKISPANRYAEYSAAIQELMQKQREIINDAQNTANSNTAQNPNNTQNYMNNNAYMQNFRGAQETKAQRDARIDEAMERDLKLNYEKALKAEEAITTTHSKKVIEAVNEGDKTDTRRLTVAETGKSMLNGIVKIGKGLVCGEDGKFSWLKLGKTVLIGALAITASVALPGVGTALVVAGAAAGGLQLGKGVIKAATANTVAERKSAWEDVGGGAATVIASRFGAGAAARAANVSKVAAAASNASKTTKLGIWAKNTKIGQCVRGTIVSDKNTRSLVKSKGWKDAGGLLWQDGKDNLKAAFRPKNAKENAIAKAEKQYAKDIEGIKAKQQQIREQITDLDAIKDAEKIAKLEKQIKALEIQKGIKEGFQVDLGKPVASDVDKVGTNNKTIETIEKNSLAKNDKLRAEYKTADASRQAEIVKEMRNNRLEAKNEISTVKQEQSEYFARQNKIQENKQLAKNAKTSDKVTQDVINAEKAELKTMEQKFAKLKKTDADYAAQETAIKGKKGQIDMMERSLAKEQMQIAELDAQTAALERISKTEKYSSQLKNSKEQLETLTSKKESLNEQLKLAATEDDKIALTKLIKECDNGITEANAAISAANRHLFLANTMIAVPSKIPAVVGYQMGMASPVDGPEEMHEVTKYSDQYEPMKKQLVKEYEASNKQIKDRYEQLKKNPQAANNMNWMSNPWMYQMMANGMGGGLDSTAMLRSMWAAQDNGLA